MADVAAKRMTVEEFLEWDDGTDTRYELIDGQPVAMAPTLEPHAVLLINLGAEIRTALKAKPGCRVMSGIGLRSPVRSHSYYIPDIVVACDQGSLTRRELPEPILAVEILSDSTAQIDRATKVPDYLEVPSLREILVINPRAYHAELHRRVASDRWMVHLLRGKDAQLQLESVGLGLPLATLYEGILLG